MSAELNWVDESCTLPTAERPLRVAEFGALFAASLRGVERVGPTRLRLGFDADARAEAERLTEAETACCSFFTFTFGESEDGRFELDVVVPDDRVEVLDGLGKAARS